MKSFTLKVKGERVLVRLPDDVFMSLRVIAILTKKKWRGIVVEALEKYGYRTDKARQRAIVIHIFGLIRKEKIRRGKLKSV